MRKEIHRKIRKSGPGINVAADIDSVIVVNQSTSAPASQDVEEREARRDDTLHEPRRRADGRAEPGSADRSESDDHRGGN